MYFKEPRFVIVGRERVLAPNLVTNLEMFSHTPNVVAKPALRSLVSDLKLALARDSSADTLITSTAFYLTALSVGARLKLSAEDYIEFFVTLAEFINCDQPGFARDLEKICGEVVPHIKVPKRGGYA